MKKTSSIIKIVGLAMLLMVVAAVLPASAEVTVYKINTDGSKTLVNNSNSPTVTVAQDADGKITISEDNTVIGSNNDPCRGLANCKSVTMTPDSKLPVNIVDENGSVKADKLGPSATIDAFAATTYFIASATNYRAGIGCSASSSNYYGSASAQASGTSVSCSFS